MLSDSDLNEIRAGLRTGMGGPLLVKWANLLMKDLDERRHVRATRPNHSDRQRWENVTSGVAGKREPQELTQRLRVPGGWTYRTIVRGLEQGHYSVAVCFVPEVGK